MESLALPRWVISWPPIAIVTAVISVMVCGCELPQQKAGGAADAEEGTATGGGGESNPNGYNVIRIVGDPVDLVACDGETPCAAVSESCIEGLCLDSAPGVDVDAIVAFRDDVFLFAGCSDITLMGEDDIAVAGTTNADPLEATLGVAEQSMTGGFVSLTGGTLLCELPLTLMPGDQLEIWEVEEDGGEPWICGFAESVGGDFINADEVSGSVRLTAP